MGKLSLLQRFGLLCLLALIVFAFIFGAIVTSLLENDSLERSKQLTAALISKEVNNELLPGELTAPETGHALKAFSKKIRHLSLPPDVERIKIWNSEKIVVWSDDERLIGKQFLDNEELNEALEGKIESELSELKKTEHQFERKFKRLLELYVPIQFGPGGKTRAVFEIYQNLDPLYLDIARAQNLIWTTIAVGFSLLFLVLFGIVLEGSRRIDAQNKKLIETAEELKRKDRMKTEFLSIVSHELRTPVTPIKGYLTLLLDKKLGELTGEQANALSVILKQSDHLLAMIDSILNVSRLEYGKFSELKKEPIQLNQIVRQTVEWLMEQFISKQITVKFDQDEKLPVISGDETQLVRVMENLLGNALKFTPKGGTVTVKTRVSGPAEDILQVETADNGLGLARENLEKIFEKFYQVDSSNTRVAGGLGLGLPIAREIIEAHGGKLWAESAGLGKGSKFYFTLPIT